MWYTDMLEICFFVGVLFFILGIFSIDIRGTYKEAKEFYLVIALVIMSGLHYCPIKVGKSVFEIIEIQSIKQVFEMKRI